MPKRALLAVLVMTAPVAPCGAAAQRPVQVAFADPQPHFVAAWAPTKERAAERAAVLAHRVSLELDGVPLDAALKALTSRAGLRMTYSPAALPKGKRVTLRASDVAVVTALTEMLFRSGLDVVVDRDGTLALVACRHPAPSAEVQDSGSITGRVTDKATGAPIAGATVTIEGRSAAATTDSDGQYRLAGLPDGTHALRVRYIGYVPATTSVRVAPGEETIADIDLEASVQRLDQVVVTGTIAPTEAKALPTPLTVLTAQQLDEEHLWRVDQAFRGTVPGGIAWDLGTNDYTSLIQVRGRNSLGVTPSIKTYVDGIEVADPIYIATIDPSSIERIEITRGPQSSTVYGSDASGGVMQIFTKKGTFGESPHLWGRAAVGAVQGPFSQGLPLRHDYGLALNGGTGSMAYNIGGSFVRTGEWVPGYYSRTPSASAKVSWVQGPLTAEISARYSMQTRAHVYNPSLSNLTFFSRPAFETDQLRQQTYGASLTFRASPSWEHNLIVGLDQNRFGFHNTRPRLTTPADTLLQVFSQDAVKPSIRYNTAYRAALGPRLQAVVTGGAEYYESSLALDFTADATRSEGAIDGSHFVTRTSSSNVGFFGQAQISIADALFLVGGLRGDRNENFGALYGTAWSPRVGASYVLSWPTSSVKLRASYGNAIRGVDPTMKEAVRTTLNNQLANPRLGPERQEGWDAGAEFYLGDRVSFGITHYDQKARDLIDVVYVNTDVVPPENQFQNVGAIRNVGWELEGTLKLGRLGVRGTYSRVSSTVERLGPTYGGDLRVGEQLLDVPRNTAGATVSLSASRGTRIVASMTHIGGWTGTDWKALYGYFYGTDEFRGSLRDYRIEYPSVTKFNASLSQVISPRVTAFMQIDNLGNNTRFEQNNTFIPRGRTTMVGTQFRL